MVDVGVWSGLPAVPSVVAFIREERHIQRFVDHSTGQIISPADGAAQGH